MSELCDRCINPGRCCSGFYANARHQGLTALEVLVDLATVDYRSTGNWLGLPFLPLFRSSNGRWALWCPVLTYEGRCGDYVNRPEFPCQDYQPAQDKLCAMFEDRI